ncbi:MAG: EamA family transporter [Magnetovibrio sp.]|nr:EamA family transporter [Magnetovibrio sp.]
MDTIRAYLMLTGTAVCWSGHAVINRLAVGEISPMLLVSLRWLGVVILISVIANKYIRQDWLSLKKHLPYLFVMGALGYTTFNAFFYVSGHYTHALNIGILQGSIPMFVLLGSFIFHRTKIKPLQIAGVLLTILGVCTVSFGGYGINKGALTFAIGDILMIFACLLYAGYTVGLQNRPPSSSLGLFSVLAIAALVTSIPLAAGEYILGQTIWPTREGWFVVGFVVLFPSLLAQIFFINGVKTIGPGRAGIFVNLVPVFAAIFAVTILNEPFEMFHAAALVLVLGGIGLSERAKL